jgi:hypothetical protein
MNQKSENKYYSMKARLPSQVPFENKPLQGITVKSAFWILGGLVSILASVIMTYASIMVKLDKSEEAISEIKRGKEITDVQIRAMELQLQTMEIRLVRLETQLKTKE